MNRKPLISSRQIHLTKMNTILCHPKKNFFSPHQKLSCNFNLDTDIGRYISHTSSFLNLVAIKSLFLLLGMVHNGKHNSARLIVTERVTNRLLCSIHLLLLLNYDGVWSLIRWDEFLLVADFPPQDSHVPNYCCSNLIEISN